MRHVLVTDANVAPWLPSAAAGRLPDDVELDLVPWEDRARVHEAMATAWAYVGVQLDEQTARAATENLAFVQITAAGTDHTALHALPSGIPVANAFGHGRSIAEHTLMVILALRRHLLEADSELRADRWRSRFVDPSAPEFTTIEGKTVGIVGFGHIGRSIARLLRAAGMRVIAIRHSLSERRRDPDAEWVDGPRGLEDLLDQSEVLVLACPLTEATRGLIGRAELNRLGPGSTLVNVARGPVVDEQALFDALSTRSIAGAALDVWWSAASSAPNPPSRLPFKTLENVLMTPHYSATAMDTYRERATDVVDGLVDVLADRPPRHQVLVTPVSKENV